MTDYRVSDHIDVELYLIDVSKHPKPLPWWRRLLTQAKEEMSLAATFSVRIGTGDTLGKRQPDVHIVEGGKVTIQIPARLLFELDEEKL